MFCVVGADTLFRGRGVYVYWVNVKRELLSAVLLSFYLLCGVINKEEPLSGEHRGSKCERGRLLY